VNIQTSILLKQICGRFLIHLALYPVIIIVALCILSLCVWPEGIHGQLHPFMNAAGELDQEFAPKYISDQFAYYCLIPGWLVLGIFTGVLFRLKKSPTLVRLCCLTLFSLSIFGLCLVDPRLPFVWSWAGWAPATAGLLCAIIVCYWHPWFDNSSKY
jgi:hypothetical protein